MCEEVVCDLRRHTYATGELLLKAAPGYIGEVEDHLLGVLSLAGARLATAPPIACQCQVRLGVE